MCFDWKSKIFISATKLQTNVLMFVRRWKWYRGINIVLSLPLLSCELSVFDKENPDEKKLLRSFCISFIYVWSYCQEISNVLAEKQVSSSSALVNEEMMISHMNTKNHQNLDLIIREQKRVIFQTLLQRLILFIYCENPNFQYIPLTQETIS